MLLLFQRKSFYVFVLFYIITLAFYFPARHAGFLTDFIGFEAGYQKCGLIHYYDCSLMPNLRYVQHLFTYTLWKTVGSNTIYWYILYCFFHALSAYLGFLVAKKLFNLYKVQQAFFIAFSSAFLFLISPYGAEVVVWKVCIQYCFVSIVLSLNILLLLSYFIEPKTWKPFVACLFFIIGMFAIEQAATIPLVLIVITLILSWKENKDRIVRAIVLFVVPQILFIGVYFLINKLLYHKWIMHYGAKAFKHVIGLDTYKKFFRYFFKYVFLLRFIENENLKKKIFTFIDQPVFIAVLSVLLLALLFILVKNYFNKSNKAGLYIILIALFVVTMLPVIQLYDTTLLLSENDRLGYVSSFFIFMMIALFLLDRKNKIIQVLFGFLLIVNAYFLIKITRYWNISNNIAYSFANDFKFYDRKEIVILGVPDNYKGIWVLRADNSALQELIKYKLHKEIHAKIDEVANYNQTAYEDGLNVKRENDSTLYVTFKQYGNWWWKDGIGMRNYENEKYRVTLDEWNGYHLTIKNIKEHNYTIIYPDNLKWKEFSW